MERLSKIVNGTNILILSDETYAPAIFEGYEHQSISRYPKLAERSFIISGLSKLLGTDSWQLSYCLSPEKYMSIFRKIQHLQVMSANLPFQVGLANYLNQNPDLKNAGTILQQKRDILLKNMKNSKISFLPSPGSYFQVFNYAKLSPLKDVVYCTQLFDQYKLNVTPLSYFYHDTVDLRFFRVSFAKPDDVLARANDTLLKLS
jgi:methionine aminotransferase